MKAINNFNLYLEIIQKNKYNNDFIIYDENILDDIKKIFKNTDNQIISILTAGGLSLLTAITPLLLNQKNYSDLSKEDKEKITENQLNKLKEKITEKQLNELKNKLAIKKH